MLRRLFLPTLCLVALGCDGGGPVGPTKDDSVDPTTDTEGPADPTVDPPEAVPARATDPMHRLTAREYQRAAVALTGVSPPSRDELPADEVTNGFDNVNVGQTLSPLHVDRWFEVSGQIADRALREERWTLGVRLSELDLPYGEAYEVAAGDPPSWWLIDRLEHIVRIPVTVPAAGAYLADLDAFWAAGWQAGYDEDAPTTPPRLRLDVGPISYALGPVSAHFDEVDRLTAEITLPAGTTWLALQVEGSVLNNVALGGLTLTALGEDVPGSRAMLIPCDPVDQAACAEEVAHDLIRRGWRRPPTEAEIDRLTGLILLGAGDGGSFDEGVRLALQAVLLSPKFLFLVEPDGGATPGTTRSLTPHEVAARLALVIWRSLPDEALLACADVGGLQFDTPQDDPCHLQTQIDRMVQAPAARAIAEDFGVQWLGVDALGSVWRPEDLYPDRTASVLVDMALEAVTFVDASIQADLPLREWLDSPRRWLTPQLGAVYVQPTGPGTHVRPVFPDDGRPSGVLQLASLLTATSHPTRTSPVRRGQWILSRLLCDPTGEPPPNIPALQDDVATHGTLREQLAAHAANPGCASCHDRLDPLGLALEGYDMIGRPRTEVEGLPIDASGTLPDGTSFLDDAGLAAHLSMDPQVAACFAEQVATWAWNRRPEALDQEALDAAAARSEDGFEAMLTELLLHPAFLTRTVQEPADAP
jgi:hypothetical protein